MLISSLFLASVLSAAPADVPSISRLTAVPCEFKDVYQFASATCNVELQNTGDVAIKITSIRPERIGDSVSARELLVPARGVVSLKVTVAVESDIGWSKHFFRFETNEPNQPVRYAEAKGFVSSVLDDERPEIDFGVVDLTRELPSRSLTFSSRESSDFKLVKVISAPSFVNVEIQKDGRTANVEVNKSAPWGLHEKDHIKFQVNSSQQEFVSIRLKADFHGQIVPALNPVPMGDLRTNNENEVTVRLTSQDGNDFKIGNVLTEGFKAKIDSGNCQPASRGCQLLRLKIPSDQPTGQIGGLIRIPLPDLDKEISVYAWGMLLNPETKVVDLFEEMGKQAKAAEASEELGSSRVDIKSALRDSVRNAKSPVASVEPPIGKGPVIKWSVANEATLYGYLIYRADSEIGPFLRLSAEIIKTRSSDTESESYQWRDVSAVPGSTYWYYVGTVSRQGIKSPLTSPQKALAK